MGNSNIIDAFKQVVDYLPNLFEDDVVVSISDRECYLRLLGTRQFGIDTPEGAPVDPNGTDWKCMSEGRIIKNIIPKEVFGAEVRSISIPIRDDKGEVVGCISVMRSLKRQYEILDLSKNISSALSQITSAISQISTGVQDVVESNKKMVEEASEADAEAKNTDEILKFVKNIAGQTNLLGLNAAIEAARAGEMGRGFNVVATEIRKLSTSSSESINKINDVLKKIQGSVSKISKSIEDNDSIFQEQAAALQEITASIEELGSTAQVLEEMSSKI